jgi:hypothetical protein
MAHFIEFSVNHFPSSAPEWKRKMTTGPGIKKIRFPLSRIESGFHGLWCIAETPGENNIMINLHEANFRTHRDRKSDTMWQYAAGKAISLDDLYPVFFWISEKLTKNYLVKVERVPRRGKGLAVWKIGKDKFDREVFSEVALKNAIEVDGNTYIQAWQVVKGIDERVHEWTYNKTLPWKGLRDIRNFVDEKKGLVETPEFKAEFDEFITGLTTSMNECLVSADEILDNAVIFDGSVATTEHYHKAVLMEYGTVKTFKPSSEAGLTYRINNDRFTVNGLLPKEVFAAGLEKQAERSRAFFEERAAAERRKRENEVAKLLVHSTAAIENVDLKCYSTLERADLAILRGKQRVYIVPVNYVAKDRGAVRLDQSRRRAP